MRNIYLVFLTLEMQRRFTEDLSILHVILLLCVKKRLTNL